MGINNDLMTWNQNVSYRIGGELRLHNLESTCIRGVEIFSGVL